MFVEQLWRTRQVHFDLQSRLFIECICNAKGLLCLWWSTWIQAPHKATSNNLQWIKKIPEISKLHNIYHVTLHMLQKRGKYFICATWHPTVSHTEKKNSSIHFTLELTFVSSNLFLLSRYFYPSHLERPPNSSCMNFSLKLFLFFMRFLLKETDEKKIEIQNLRKRR